MSRADRHWLVQQIMCQSNRVLLPMYYFLAITGCRLNVAVNLRLRQLTLVHSLIFHWLALKPASVQKVGSSMC